MSCSVQIKTRNSVKSKKVNNVIHRTTSETIRLGDADLLNNSSRQLTRVLSPPPLKQSSCSFQVTSVSVTQRPDYGDDSADDLDESHTDDISRVTDNETPSYSEDTCSRDAEDNYIGLCSALCSVTVIPPSSQYGLAMMPLSTSPINNNDNTTNLTKASEESDIVFITSESQSLSSPNIEVQTSRFPGTRFKVVKVETSRPFRRGRWWCMDYLDESPYAPKNAFTYKSSGGLEICSELQYTMTATSLQTQNSVEFGTNLNSTDPTKFTDITNPKLICSVSELHSSYYPHSRKDKLVNHLPKVQSHLHVPSPNSNLKNKNGAIPSLCIDHNLYCKPYEKVLSNDTIDQSASTNIENMKSDIYLKIDESLKFDLDSLMGLSLVDIIHNSLQQDFNSDLAPPMFNKWEASVADSQSENKPCNSIPPCHKTETVSSYLAWELFTQTPRKSSSNSCILNKASLHTAGNSNYQNIEKKDSLSEVSNAKFSIKRQNSAPAQSVTTSIGQPSGIDSVPTTTQANTSSPHKLFLASNIDGSSSAEDSVDIIKDSSVLSTYPIMSNPFSIFDDIGIFATHAIFDNFTNSHSPNAARIIDERIAVALDLVKRYLLYAVHEEVDALKHHITILLQRVRQLEHENMFLRANVPPHVLNILYGLPSRHPLHHSNHPGNGTTPPPPPPSN